MKSEKKMKKVEIDPIKYEILYNRIEQALLEGKATVKRLSASVIVRDAGEVSQGVYLKNGTLVHMAAGVLIHVSTLSRSIRFMIENRYEEDIGFYDGDQFINNDSLIGGFHRPDQLMIAPLFYNEELIGWLGNFSHVSEIGAMEPGGMIPSAKESYHEGICLPCVKIVERGKMRRDILQMMARTGRTSREMEIDTRAKIAGNERVRDRIVEIIEEFGVDFYQTAVEQMVQNAEEQARKKIAQLKPGVYRNRVYLDNMGMEEKLGIIELEMEVTKDADLILRTPVISPQRKGSNNLTLAAMEAAMFSGLLTLLYYDIRWNEGALNPVKLEIPERSTLNVDKTGAISLGVIGVGKQCRSLLDDVMSRAFFVSGNYEDIIASSPAFNCNNVSGIDQFGRFRATLYLECMGSGGGARYDMDGIESSGFEWNPWSEVPDVESQEMDVPMLCFSRRLIPDTGGYGKYRGGSAIEALYMVHGTPEIMHGSIGSSGKVSGLQGLFGGYPEPITFLCVVRNNKIQNSVDEKRPLPHSSEDLIEGMVNGEIEMLPPSSPITALKKGDIVCLAQWGAAGLGDPIERDPALIVKDIEKNFTTLKVAKKIYCVDINPETFKVNEEKTKLMREEKRKERLSKGVPAKDYIKKMVDIRRSGNLPETISAFFEETKAFCEGFRRELDVEESLVISERKGSEKIADGKAVFKLTPYVDVVEAKGKKVLICSRCNHYYCELGGNFKHHCLIYDRDPKEIYPGRFGPDKGWMIYREFYCPGCGSMVEVEATPAGTPIMNTVEIKE